MAVSESDSADAERELFRRVNDVLHEEGLHSNNWAPAVAGVQEKTILNVFYTRPVPWTGLRVSTETRAKLVSMGVQGLVLLRNTPEWGWAPCISEGVWPVHVPDDDPVHHRRPDVATCGPKW